MFNQNNLNKINQTFKQYFLYVYIHFKNKLIKKKLNSTIKNNQTNSNYYNENLNKKKIKIKKKQIITRMLFHTSPAKFKLTSKAFHMIASFIFFNWCITIWAIFHFFQFYIIII